MPVGHTPPRSGADARGCGIVARPIPCSSTSRARRAGHGVARGQINCGHALPAGSSISGMGAALAAIGDPSSRSTVRRRAPAARRSWVIVPALCARRRPARGRNLLGPGVAPTPPSRRETPARVAKNGLGCTGGSTSRPRHGGKYTGLCSPRTRRRCPWEPLHVSRGFRAAQFGGTCSGESAKSHRPRGERERDPPPLVAFADAMAGLASLSRARSVIVWAPA